MSEKNRLRKKDAKKIANFTVAIAKELGIAGFVVVVDRGLQYEIKKVQGIPRPVTEPIATNKANQSAFTGARTGVTAEAILKKERTLGLYGLNPEKFVPFPGGCPIYTLGGVLIGGAGFSEQTGTTDERIVATAIESCGFLSDTPKMEDIPLGKIIEAAKEVAIKMKELE